MANLYNPEIETFVLAGILQFPDIWGEIGYLLEDKDFNKVNKPVFSVLKQQLDLTPPASVAPVALAEKLKAYGVVFEAITPQDYLDALVLKPIKQDQIVSLVKELKFIRSKRDMVEMCENTKNSILHDTGIKSFDGLEKLVTTNLSLIHTQYHAPKQSYIFEGLIEKIEMEGNEQLKDNEFGFMSPFPSINRTIGPLSYESSMCLVGARSGQSKSALSWFYHMYMAEKYGLKVLALDAAEMSEDEIGRRAICALSGGVVKYGDLLNRTWRKSPELVDLIRGEIWPRVTKIIKQGDIAFHNIGGMEPKEIVSLIRRHYYKHVGKDNHLLINLDYIKATESFNKGGNEHQTVGNYIMDLKNLITQDGVKMSLWLGIQNNRSGAIHSGGNQRPGDIQEASDDQFGLSDRIVQQATHAFNLRYKTPEELGLEKNLFGNIRFSCVKKRRMTGRDANDLLQPVKLPSGKFANNYFNLNTKSFYFEDKGTLKDSLVVLGNTVDTVNTVNINKDKITRQDLL